MGLILLWKMQRANFSFSTAQFLGFPRRSALYKHYAQADVTWLVLRPP